MMVSYVDFRKKSNSERLGNGTILAVGRKFQGGIA
jgi:hypothetical protein